MCGRSELRYSGNNKINKRRSFSLKSCIVAGEMRHTNTDIGSSKCNRRAQNKCGTNAAKEEMVTTTLGYFSFACYAYRSALDQ